MKASLVVGVVLIIVLGVFLLSPSVSAKKGPLVTTKVRSSK